MNPGKRRNSNRVCASAALAALLIYPLAISLPIMRIERFGHQHDASIWTGSVELLSEGEVFVGIVVLVCSIVIPLFKLVGLLMITRPASRLSHHHRAFTYRVIEWTGRWGMLDVLLIALLVAWIKVGDLVQVSVGPAALAFTLCVLLSLVATAWTGSYGLTLLTLLAVAAPIAVARRVLGLWQRVRSGGWNSIS